MKILVFSDSHNDVETMAAIVTAETPDMIFHLGDHVTDAMALSEMFPSIPIKNVLGNTDLRDEGSAEEIFEIEGRKILLTHGDRYDVTWEAVRIDVLLRRCADVGADILLFGHSHQPFVWYRANVWLLNPGRIGRKSSQKIYATYGLLFIEGGKVEYRIKEA